MRTIEGVCGSGGSGGGGCDGGITIEILGIDYNYQKDGWKD